MILTIDSNFLGIAVSVISFIFAVIFWVLASKQAEDASRTLGEIKDKIMSWQDDMNKAAISLIQARPEVMAQQVTLEETMCESRFSDSMASIVEKLLLEPGNGADRCEMEIVKELLGHQRDIVLSKERIKADILKSSKEHSQDAPLPTPEPPTKTDES